MTSRYLPAVAVAAGLMAVAAPTAAAEPPDLPGAPDYVPGAPTPEPGSFSYPYNIIVTGPPATTDARGVRITTNAAAGQQLSGLPGSQLGNTGQAAGSLTNSSASYGISVGNSHPEPPSPGINISAGPQTSVTLESADGQSPQSVLGIESALPTTDPTVPVMNMEDPHGQHPAPATN
ncbi:hypothetical protein BVC93_27695 [Mycobacterium sp. MS1601]|uniref:hypothetical protein n=1 Tax=Mycobacterium sp. MS1601 TaxID=1936029 RepID=UPI0009790DED|nr:hypothetical protein [Mycobacterium sp. MS1601]AQA05530.1 hypothetical protein BVC93_27695 [Mycobacterium sp. MS1601]